MFADIKVFLLGQLEELKNIVFIFFSFLKPIFSSEGT